MEENEMMRLFEEALCAGAAARRSFALICKNAGIPRRALERCLMDTLGVDGDTVVKCYRHDLPLPFCLEL